MDIFKGFLSLAFKVSSQNYLDEEITFLIGIFTKNGHSRTKLEKITREYENNVPKSIKKRSKIGTKF